METLNTNFDPFQTACFFKPSYLPPRIPKPSNKNFTRELFQSYTLQKSLLRRKPAGTEARHWKSNNCSPQRSPLITQSKFTESQYDSVTHSPADEVQKIKPASQKSEGQSHAFRTILGKRTIIWGENKKIQVQEKNHYQIYTEKQMQHSQNVHQHSRHQSLAGIAVVQSGKLRSTKYQSLQNLPDDQNARSLSGENNHSTRSFTKSKAQQNIVNKLFKQ